MTAKKSSRVDLDEFLKNAVGRSGAGGRGCSMCKHKEAAEATRQFFEKLASGATSVSFKYFHEQYLERLEGYTIRYNGGALNHVRNCLKLDPTTGKARR